MNWQKYTNISLKILIFFLVLHAFFYHDLAQYQDKGMSYRLIGYPLVAFSICLLKLASENPKVQYPYKTDILLSLIISLDMLGNALGFYGSIEWWDDIMHLVNNGLMTLLFINILINSLKKPYIFLLTLGIVSWLQISWEIAEYVTFLTINSHEIPTAYRDTIGDLFFGQLGSIFVTITLLIINKRKVSNT